MEHTPIPWHVGDNKLEISSNHDPNGCTATCYLRVNAAFIVRAVNNHAKLLAALEDGLRAVPRPQPTRRGITETGQRIIAWKEQARAAIEEAKK